MHELRSLDLGLLLPFSPIPRVTRMARTLLPSLQYRPETGVCPRSLGLPTVPCVLCRLFRALHRSFNLAYHPRGVCLARVASSQRRRRTFAVQTFGHLQLARGARPGVCTCPRADGGSPSHGVWTSGAFAKAEGTQREWGAGPRTPKTGPLLSMTISFGRCVPSVSKCAVEGCPPQKRR